MYSLPWMSVIVAPRPLDVHHRLQVIARVMERVDQVVLIVLHEHCGLDRHDGLLGSRIVVDGPRGRMRPIVAARNGDAAVSGPRYQ